MNAKWTENADNMYKMANSSNLIKKTEKIQIYVKKLLFFLRLPAMEELKMIDTELTYQFFQGESTESFSTLE